ncbi:protein kinase domain protein [Penicillium brasilianum]|uniref:Protein kinase domain protein n=1 Tax=Penicillium brasilianum TaxID=104259 RepID=A0A1S9RZP4_PENBI|nr:protein kinase domain protein [Penicillium brasilianum]
MTPRLSSLKAAVRKTPHPSQRSLIRLTLETRIKEETLPHYDTEQFYPVHIGDEFDGRYGVTGKLGFGAYSTSWLCQDLRYAVLKVSTSLRKFPTATDREFKIYERLGKIKSAHPGQSLIRELYDSFELQGHADLKTDNLMLSLEDNTMLADFADEEASRQFRRPFREKSFGLPILCDLGEARIGKTQESGPFVQPNVYRAPEIIFEMAWGSAVDIWNLGALIWDLFEGQHLFEDIFDSNGNHDPFKHLALMVALIGPPPVDFVQGSETTGQCFDHNGTWIAHQDAAVPPTSFESLEKRLSGAEKESFLHFVRSMLKWLPEERKTVRQLLDDPWLL